jgi:ABC-2 type transport system ATP-binding protein
MSRQSQIIALGTALLIGFSIVAVSQSSSETISGVEKVAQIQTEPGVFIDTTLYIPAVTPAPVLLLAHGFGGSKDTVEANAKYFQENGYVVLTWSARGFGESSGLISMNSQSGEIADITKLIDYLESQPEVEKDSQGDPLLGISGASYGGAASLLASQADSRIDAAAADITWHNLGDALFPQTLSNSEVAGPFKKVWTGTFFALATLQRAYLGECGSLADEWCTAYKNAVLDGEPTAEDRALLDSVSPEKSISSIKIPTLLMQGQADSLFPLSESLKNLALLEQSVPAENLALIWHASGHDGGPDESKYLLEQNLNWFNKHLRMQEMVFPKFQFTRLNGSISLQDTSVIPKVFQSSQLPNRSTYEGFDLSTQITPFAYPVGGIPSAISALPGIGSAGALASSLLSGVSGFSPAFIPGQSAFIESEELDRPLSIVGSSKIKVLVTSTTGEATLFFSLVTRSPSGATSQPNGIVAPIKLIDIPENGVEIELELPAVILDVAAGDKLALGISSTDQGFEMPKTSAFYTVTALSPLSVPTLEVVASAASGNRLIWPLLAFGVLLLSIILVYINRPKTSKDVRQENVLVSIENLSKIYKDGYQAVSNLSFTVSRGQVLGLLGPNGAGKTTTLRILMGLIFPTQGAIYLGGKAVYPGSPSLSNLGSFVEGPGFLPHLSGRENLELYWKAIGRTGENFQDEVIAIANLGTALDKKVRSYSQGMRQRLAIAQAMLGMPDLLVLDEPTNGLDPQQIVEMRQVLRDYAATGRTVIVSSHLLAEVQQTCTDVVLMHRGKLIAFGPMQEILNSNNSLQSLEDIFLELIGDDLVIGKVRS